MRRAISVTSVLCAVGLNLCGLVAVVYAQSRPQLISAVLEGPFLTDRIQKTAMTFTRDSVAYESDGLEVAAGAPRFEKLAIFNRPEYTLAGPYNRENIVALAYCNGYFWGAKYQTAKTTGNSLYRSIDANNWEPVATLPSQGVISSLYVTQAELLLVGVKGPPGSVFVWDNKTGVLLKVLTMLSRNPYPNHWSWAEMNGVIYVGEYGSKTLPENSRRIYRSLDGGWNWEVLYDPPPMDGYHVHKVLADPYRSHIYFSRGDCYPNGSGSQLFRSADGGQSWNLISNTEQPAAGVARPEGTYFGSDNGYMGIYRFPDGSEKGEFVCTSLVGGYIWDMREFDDVIYATSYTYEHYGPPNEVISKDGEHWGNLYQWSTGVNGLERFACEYNGIIYAVMAEKSSQDVTTMSFPEPVVRTSWGIAVEPAEENLLANSCYSSFEGCTQSYWSPYNSAIEVSSDRAHSGNNSLKVRNAGNPSTMEVTSPVVYGNFPAGTVVSATARISGWNIDTPRIWVGIWDRTNGKRGAWTYERIGNGWSELTVYWQLPLNSRLLCVDILTWSSTSETVFYVDSVALAINQVPVSFHIGGQKRAPEVLSHRVVFPSCWTDVFCWQPPYSPSVVDQPKVIKSWSVEDGSSWLQLVLDEARNFKLEEVNGVSTKTLASVPAPDFLPKSLIRFAVVQDVNEIALHILCPQGWLLASGSRTEVCPTVVFFGSTPQGTMHAGGLYSNARVYDANMTHERIVQAIDEIAEQGWLSGDMDGDGDITFRDLSKFAESWLGTNCDSPGWCGKADLDMSCRVDFSDFVILTQNWNRKE